MMAWESAVKSRESLRREGWDWPQSKRYKEGQREQVARDRRPELRLKSVIVTAWSPAWTEAAAAAESMWET